MSVRTEGCNTTRSGHSSILPEQVVHETATYRCDDTRGCVIQFWPPDDEHMCSKHVKAWNKLIVKQKILCIILVNYWEARSAKRQNLLFMVYINEDLVTEF